MINIKKIPNEYIVHEFEDDNLDPDDELIPNKSITPKFDNTSLYYLKMSYTICYNAQVEFAFTAVININTNQMHIHPLVPRNHYCQNLKDYDDQLNPIFHYNPKTKFPENPTYLGPVLGQFCQEFNKNNGSASSHMQIVRLIIHNNNIKQLELLIPGYIRTNLLENADNLNYKQFTGIIMGYHPLSSPSAVTYKDAANFRGFTLFVNSYQEDDYYYNSDDDENVRIENKGDMTTQKVGMALYGNSRGLNALVPLLIKHDVKQDNLIQKNNSTNGYILNQISCELKKTNIELSEKDAEFLKKGIINETKKLKYYKLKPLPSLFYKNSQTVDHSNKNSINTVKLQNTCQCTLRST